MVIPFIKYYLGAETKYGIHSPFVFDFLQEVLEDDRRYYSFDDIDYLRAEYLKDSRKITVKDLGSGSKKMNAPQRAIQDIAKNSLTGPNFGALLFRLSLWKKPKTILELGTSLGLSIAYLTSPLANAEAITLEGCPNTAAIARTSLDKLGLQSVKIQIGAFADTLDQVTKDLAPLDLVFLDGHHSLEPTLAYWKQIKPYLNEGALIIMDDIHWSEGMEEAWEKIRCEEGVSCSLDLFYKGLIFWKQPGVSNQHYRLIHSKWKPWRMGFFK